MENAGENVKARAREEVGYPENDEDWTLSLKIQRATGILWFRDSLHMFFMKTRHDPSRRLRYVAGHSQNQREREPSVPRF